MSNKSIILSSVWFFCVKWFVLKPLVKINYIVNGKHELDKSRKWYQSKLTIPLRSVKLSRVSYKLTIYTMFRKR